MKLDDLERINDLKSRVDNLPLKIIDDIDFELNKSVDEPLKERAVKYYLKQQKIYRVLDDILQDTGAFIKIMFSDKSEYYTYFVSIGFDYKSEGIKNMNTFTIDHNIYWKDGRSRLYNLLRDIEAEIKLSKELKPKTANNVIINTTGDGNIVNTGDENSISSKVIIRKKEDVLPPGINYKQNWLEKTAWIATIIGVIIAFITLFN